MDIRDKKTLRFCVIFLFLIALCIVLSIFLATFISKQYTSQRYYFISNVIGNIKEKYPNATDDTIINILNEKGYKYRGDSELKKYGIDSDFDFKYYGTDFNMKVTIALVTSFSLVIISFFINALLFIKKQNKKIKEINNYANEILNNNYNLDLRNNEEGELSILKNKIYDMTVMLKEKNELLDKDKIEMEKLLADISHQLKTPLTSLSIINDLLYQDLPENKKREFLDSMSKELYKLEWLVKTVLNLAKLDSKTLILKKENVNIFSMLNKLITNFNALCESYDANISIVNDEVVSYVLDEKWTMEAVGNIIKNAIEHGGQNIKISYNITNLYLQINIKDDGEGIDKTDITHIFDRFYKSKNSNANSLGLGLAFSKSIIRNQNGEIKVKSKLKQGTEFVIKLYK